MEHRLFFLFRSENGPLSISWRQSITICLPVDFKDFLARLIDKTDWWAKFQAANTRHPPNAGFMLGQRRRRWPRMKPALANHLDLFFPSYLTATSMNQYNTRHDNWYIISDEMRSCVFLLGIISDTISLLYRPLAARVSYVPLTWVRHVTLRLLRMLFFSLIQPESSGKST